MKLLIASIALHSREPPKEFLLLPFGENKFRWMDNSEHTVMVTPEIAQRVVERAAQHKPKAPIDYNHASQKPRATAEEGKAAGWFSLEVRGDGLWMSNIEWTEQAIGFLKNKEYNYFSPVWTEDDNDVLLELHNVALTFIAGKASAVIWPPLRSGHI